VLETLNCITELLSEAIKKQLPLSKELVTNEVLETLVATVYAHENVALLKSLSVCFLELSKQVTFLGELARESLIQKLVFKQISKGLTPESLANFFEFFRNFIQSTRLPVKYLLAAQILQLSEDPKVKWERIPELNCHYLIKVLKYIIKFFKDQTAEEAEQPLEKPSVEVDPESLFSEESTKALEKKTISYSLKSMTNILIQIDADLLFDRKLRVLSLLQEHCRLESDIQMNLRFLQLLNISLTKKRTVLKLLEEDDIEREEEPRFMVAQKMTMIQE